MSLLERISKRLDAGPGKRLYAAPDKPFVLVGDSVSHESHRVIAAMDPAVSDASVIIVET